MRRRAVLRRATPCALAAALVVASAAAVVSSTAPASARADTDLYLVALDTPGTATETGYLTRSVRTLALAAEQDAVLEAVGSPLPVYRWTTALNGFAVELDAEQAAALAALPDVALVERNDVRTVAAVPPGAATGAARYAANGPSRGGAGVVIGVVDTGLAPDSPLFAQRTASRPAGFGGVCQTAADWADSECTGKVVGARWYVEGFGADAVRAASTLSPRDSDGHGTATASIAAGNAGVPVRVGGENLGQFGGAAPEAHLAVYKACWSAPDPSDDGCATADLVSAIDDATRDGVDVLTLAVSGPGTIDTVERALLGATEAGVVVVAAAGNDGAGNTAHPAPWVTTVGGATGDERRGTVALPGERAVPGAMLSNRDIGPARVVVGSDVAAAGTSTDEARVCAPGSLDAARVAGRIVVCERGRVGRVDKSGTVALADGLGMVLVNPGPGSVDADVHSVPTVHLAAGAGRRLLAWVAAHPEGRIRLRSQGLVQRRPRVATFSGSGTAATGVVKPDVVAPASGVLAAVPGTPEWDFVTGTSAATARTAGVAALLLSSAMPPAQVRSALVTTARPLTSSGTLRGGAGLLRPDQALRPGLAYLTAPTAYRAWLEGRRARLNSPSVVLAGGALAARRTITNVTGRRLYFSSSARGFRRDVEVRPAAVRLGPGESVTFRVRVSQRGGARLDEGHVVWRGARGTVTRLPVVVTR